ncbi:MAG: penicillin-binding protein [Clostridia bacterium]|nr:penicillin-binding protein [Clostridia bacterium]
MSVRAVIMLVITSVFVAGLCILCMFYVTDGDDWALYPANTHIFNEGHVSKAGSITDRNGVVLSHSVDGVRKYNDDLLIRKSTLHAVGDLDGFISTGLHTSYLPQLVGFDSINGVYQFSGTGNNIKTTLDSSVCQVALEALGNRAGTVGVYNYKTGEIICMVSTPTYDINSQSDSKKAKDGEYKGVYINRFLSATYTPGSTFKIITAAAGIDTFEDIYDRVYTCKGGVEIDGEWISCMGNHGKTDIKEAVAYSCNAYFSQLAVDIGKDKMMEYAEKAGFNQEFYMDGIKAETSYFNVENTRNIDLAWAGMGQYTNMMNPLQYLTAVGAIANGGVPKKPYMVKSITAQNGLPLRQSIGQNGSRMISKDTADKVAELMSGAVQLSYGSWNFKGLDVCAKSGTAEVGEDKTPHAEFVGFVRNEELPLAFVVVVENGGTGRTVAGGVASKVLAAAKKSLVGE